MSADKALAAGQRLVVPRRLAAAATPGN
jgi:hypothetical protein